VRTIKPKFSGQISREGSTVRKTYSTFKFIGLTVALALLVTAAISMTGVGQEPLKLVKEEVLSTVFPLTTLLAPEKDNLLALVTIPIDSVTLPARLGFTAGSKIVSIASKGSRMLKLKEVPISTIIRKGVSPAQLRLPTGNLLRPPQMVADRALKVKEGIWRIRFDRHPIKKFSLGREIEHWNIEFFPTGSTKAIKNIHQTTLNNWLKGG